MPRSRRPAILGSALVVLAFHGRQVIAAPRTWIEVKSLSFTVVSDAGVGSARNVAWQFEQARAAFTRLWSWARPRGGKPFVVFAARDESSLKALAPEYWEPKDAVRPVSVTVTGAAAHYLTLRVDADTPRDEAKAIATLSALCDGGQKEACTMLALQYAGKATAHDQARARELLKKACDAGEPAACRALQSMPK
jgi:hypothetical protein